jgi:hypothetical protein
MSKNSRKNAQKRSKQAERAKLEQAERAKVEQFEQAKMERLEPIEADRLEPFKKEDQLELDRVEQLKQDDVFQSEHVTHLKGHADSDVIVIYSKYGDCIKDSKKEHENLCFPQWFCTDMRTATSGIWLPMSQLVACTPDQMKKLSKDSLKRAGVRGSLGNVKFYYSKTIMTMNGMEPFK